MSKAIIELITEKKIEYAGMDPKVKWELLKFEVRMKLITLSADIARKRNSHYKTLTDRMKELSSMQDFAQVEFEEFNCIKRELSAIQRESERAKLFRSKCDWAMYRGKASKYFLNLEKKKYQDKTFSQLYDGDGNLVTDKKEILEIEKSFFQNLYTKTVSDNNEECERYLQVDTRRIQQTDKELLDSDLTLEELEEALKRMKSNKSPGSDGLSVEFYRKFWTPLKDVFLECINEIFKSGQLTEEQKRGVITLIPKKNKDKRFITSWRPITLLNLDYKIITKCLTNRMLGVLPDLIHENQTGFMPGRLIGTNIRNINDAIRFWQEQEEGGLIVSLDFAKAFDSIDREYMYRVLASNGFGEKFLRWIKIIYFDVQSCVINNGNSSGWFGMEAGLKQGCALSPFWFVLAVEKLAEYIRKDSSIKGIIVTIR